jgi:hypothetical protein
MRKILFGAICVFFGFYSLGQEISNSAKKSKNQLVSSEYDRNSLTILGLKSPGELNDRIALILDTLKVQDKFYSNDIGFRNIPYKVDFTLFDRARHDVIYKTDVLQLLGSQKVGQGILARWFNRQGDGTFNTDVLKERGIYNSDDSDFSLVNATKRGQSSLMDAGLSLVDKSYVMVIGYSNLITMNQHYDQIKATPENRKLNGVKGDMIGMLYKIDFSDSISTLFFNDMWTAKGTPDPEKKAAAFNSFNFPFKPVKYLVMPLQATQSNPGQSSSPKVQKTQDQLLQEVVNTSVEGLLNSITTLISEFKVKGQIYKTKPIAIKIGKKEGLGFDQRYFVFENRENSKGQKYSERVGVIKSMSVADNRVVSKGETDPSYFYQVAGGKIDNLGMFAEQRNDAGLNLFIGYQSAGLSGATGRLEYYLGRVLYSSKSNKISRGLTSFKLYVEGGYNMGDYTLQTSSGKESLNIYHISAGLNKDFYIMNSIHWGPFIGYGIESGKGKTSESESETGFVETGIRLGINLKYNIQLVGSANYYYMLTPKVKDKDGKEIVTDSYSDIFPDRGEFGITGGIRFMF